MSISGIGTTGYPTRYTTSKAADNTFGKGFDNTLRSGNDAIKKNTDTVKQTSAMDIYNSMNGTSSILPIDLKEYKQYHDKKLSYEKEEDEKKEDKDSNQESETQTDIIVRADGSRVMVMVMKVGGTEITTSVQISQKTETPNDKLQQDANHEDMPSSGIGAVLDECQM